MYICPTTPTSNGRSSRPSSTHSTPLESAKPVSSPEPDGMRLWPRLLTLRELHLPPSSNGLQAAVGRQRASRDRQKGEPRSGRRGRGGGVAVIHWKQSIAGFTLIHKINRFLSSGPFFILDGFTACSHLFHRSDAGTFTLKGCSNSTRGAHAARRGCDVTTTRTPSAR